MKDETKVIENEAIESFNVFRAYVMAQLSRFRRPGMNGQTKVVEACMNYFDLIVRGTTEQGQKPVAKAKELRKTLSGLLLLLVVEFDNGHLSAINAASQVAGLVVEYGYKTFGVDAEFFMQPETDILPQSLN